MQLVFWKSLNLWANYPKGTIQLKLLLVPGEIVMWHGNLPDTLQISFNILVSRYSSSSSLEVSTAQIQEFELKWKVRVLRLNSSLSERNEVHKISPIMNVICEQLWIRDQDYLLKQGLNPWEKNYSSSRSAKTKLKRKKIIVLCKETFLTVLVV